MSLARLLSAPAGSLKRPIRRAIVQRLHHLGHELSGPQVDRVIARLKSLEKGATVDDELLRGWVEEANRFSW